MSDNTALKSCPFCGAKAGDLPSIQNGREDAHQPTYQDLLGVLGKSGVETSVTLTRNEAAFVLNELHSQGHGQGSSKDDFEPECPTCTAADKIKAALADGVNPSEGMSNG